MKEFIKKLLMFVAIDLISHAIAKWVVEQISLAIEKVEAEDDQE